MKEFLPGTNCNDIDCMLFRQCKEGREIVDEIRSFELGEPNSLQNQINTSKCDHPFAEAMRIGGRKILDNKS